MRAYERLLKYVSVYTTSDPDSATVPAPCASTIWQTSSSMS